ncbi:MAG: TRAP transporter small permease [Gammaproteobacteria bacterium]
MRTAERLLKILSGLERLGAFLAFLVLIGVVFLDVASREVTGTGLHWAMQVGVYANLVVVLLGIGITSAAGAHLRPRFADGWLPRAWDGVLGRLQEGVTGLFFAAFAIVGALVVAETRELGERAPVLGNLVWPLQALIPAVSAAGAVRHLIYSAWPALRPRQPAASPANPEASGPS